MNGVPESVIAALEADVPPSYVLDLWAVEECGVEASEWAQLRGAQANSITSHAGMARRQVPAYTGGRGDA